MRDPAVDSLSSFIGVDGSNTTLNNGRMLINLKPLAERRQLSDIMRAPAGAHGDGDAALPVYLQPVQDLTHRRRGQPCAIPIYPAGDPAAGLNHWVPRW